jgi:lambda family phage portal protein
MVGWTSIFRRASAPATTLRERVEPSVRSAGQPSFRMPRGRGGALREFQAGTVDMLTADYPALARSGNAALRPALRVMRSRSRQLSENNDYMREFLRILGKKVLGPKGIRLAVRAMRPDGKTVDQADSDYLSESFATFAKKGTCTVCGRYSWNGVQQLVLRTLARDGEILVRFVRKFPNRWGFALQLLECDVLDEGLNVARGAGYGGIDKPMQNEIRMGVERDPWGRIVAYHILTRHPGDDLGVYQSQTRYERVAAADMLHIFMPDRLDDARGAPWAWTAIRRLLMSGGYEEAELVAARLGASKGGFFTEQVDGELTGDDSDAAGNIIQDVQPGQFERLPPGVDFKPTTRSIRIRISPRS